MRKVLAVAAAGFMLALGAVFTAHSAMAGVTDHYPSAGWQVRDADAEGNRPDAAKSEIVNATTVKLTRDKSDIGTSIETVNLDLSVDNNEKLTVNYALSGEATTAAGAVRMFIYNAANADTNKTAPFAMVVAEAESGTLEIPLNGVGNIGTMGLVYDASNASTGTVTFSNLAVGDQKILFVKPLIEVTPHFDAEESVTDATCEAAGTLTLPEQDGVKFTRDPATGTGKVTVTATAEEGYKLTEGTYTWEVNIPAKLPADSDECKEPTTEPTVTPTTEPTTEPTASPTVAPTTSAPGNGGGVIPTTSNVSGDLPLTGTSKMTMIGIGTAGVLLLVGGGLLLFVARRRRDSGEVEFTV